MFLSVRKLFCGGFLSGFFINSAFLYCYLYFSIGSLEFLIFAYIFLKN